MSSVSRFFHSVLYLYHHLLNYSSLVLNFLLNINAILKKVENQTVGLRISAVSRESNAVLTLM